MLQLVLQLRDELRAKGLYRDGVGSNEASLAATQVRCHGRNHDGDKRYDATTCNSDGGRTDDGASVIEALFAGAGRGH